MNPTQTARELIELASKATPGKWFVAERPWDDRSTAVYGNRTLKIGPDNDPHGARLIADFDVTMEWIEGEPDGCIEDRANASYTAACSPDVIQALMTRYLKMEEFQEKVALYMHTRDYDALTYIENAIADMKEGSNG